MLKKNNKILVGCLALLFVMAVGYALFSETITINGTATAKGEFDMIITCIDGIDLSVASLDSLELEAENGYENPACSINDNLMTYSVNLLYPGARKYFTVKITNNGTMDALLNLSNISTEQYEACIDSNENDTFESNECTNDTFMYYDLIPSANDIYGYEKSDGTKINLYEATDEELEEFFDEDSDSMKIKPGDSGYIFIVNRVRSDWEYFSHSNKLNAKTTRTVKFNFTQVTG